MSILGHSLGLRVTLLSVAITAAALIGTSLVAGDRARSMVLERGAEETRAVADQLVELCDLAQTAVQDKIESDLAFARMALQARAAGEPAWSERLRLDEQATETVGPFTVPRLLLDDASLTGDTGLVDSVREATGSTCTIFQLLPGRWVRVATNVKRPDGSRATGTTLDEGSPVYETVMAGRTYYGNNVIQGTRFYTAYEPIRDAEGRIVMVLYVGVPYDEMADLASIIGEAFDGEGRRTWVVDGDGRFVVHESRTGEDGAELPAVQAAMRLGDGTLEYELDGATRIAAVRRFEPFDWTIVAESDEAVLTAAARAQSRAMILVGVLGTMAAAVLMFVALRSLLGRPLRALVDRVRDLAEGEGDLTRRVDESRADELGELARHLNAFLESTERVVAEVKQGADAIGSGTDEVSGSAQHLAENASRQAASLQQITASLEDIRRAACSTDEGVRRADGLSTEAREAADRGHEECGHLGEAMDEISRSGEDMANVIRTIDAIAFQTNLLALNAAVEAARAGDAGKGFAVVAEEVRGLAGRSAEAARETSRMIETSMSRTERAVELSGRVAEVLAEIADRNARVRELLGEVTDQAARQRESVEEIGRGTVELDQMAQASAGSAEELAAAAETTASQCGELRGSVGRFKVREHRAGSNAIG